jgi:DNA-binding response OmpR family regulator
MGGEPSSLKESWGNGSMRLLVIEDNHRLNTSLSSSLVHEGYSVDSAYEGQEGQDLAELTAYDLIILDILLPGKDGLEVCRDLRRRRIQTPILLLTARDSIDDRVQGLDCGADDYLVKPFAMRELLARLRALLRRQQPLKQGCLTVGKLVVDPMTHSVEREGRSIDLTPKEFALLEYLMYHSKQVVTREMIEQHIWNYDFECESNVIDVHVRRLRRKIDKPFEVKLLTTVRGIGYRLQPSPEQE